LRLVCKDNNDIRLNMGRVFFIDKGVFIGYLIAMLKESRNHLFESVVEALSSMPRGKVLDLGCGHGDYSKRLQEIGFEVVAGDIDISRFRYRGEIDFRICDITKMLPFTDACCDYVVLMEVVEHLRNPYSVMAEINRVLKPGGRLIISTPNILNLKSRLRFLFEGSYEYFREPPLDQAHNPKETIPNLHIVPYRYHELEFLLSDTGFSVEKVLSSFKDRSIAALLIPLIRFQAWQKTRRSLKKDGLDFTRINRIILSSQLLFSRHLVIVSSKKTLP